ncbi:glycosyltransferase [Halorussus ruber]|uniref:glycosyltransferase n=1 Tax=Halorussus ruber TaxID=1126238 RepID=UPI00109214DD|nr:glycosyltransferase [Halorussus ruber]
MTDEESGGDRRVAIFHTHLEIGGVERVLVNLIDELTERGYEVDLLLVSEEGAFRPEVPDDVRTMEIDRGRAPGIGIFASVVPLARYLRRVEPDALLTGKPNPNMVAILARHLASVSTRTVVSFHGMTSDQIANADELTHAAKTELSKYLYPRAGRIVAVSEGVKTDAAEVLGIAEEDVSVVYNPVVTPELLEKGEQSPDHPWFEDDAPVVLAAGRLHPYKNYSLLIEAFDRLREEMDARLMILGEGQTRPKLEARVEELGLDESVALPGSTDNPYPYMREASVLAVSSNSEALPSTLIEAMAFGCPVVSTNCSKGPREILNDGEFGPLVPTEDADALAAAMYSTLRDPPDPGRLRDRAMDFTAENVVTDYEKLLFEDNRSKANSPAPTRR